MNDRARAALGPGSETASTTSEFSVSAVPSTRPWARRSDAHEIADRYQRSVHDWHRRPRPDWSVVGSRTVQVRSIGVNTTELTGAAGPIVAACQKVGAPFARSTRVRVAWLVRNAEVDDVLALLRGKEFAVDEVLL